MASSVADLIVRWTDLATGTAALASQGAFLSGTGGGVIDYATGEFSYTYTHLTGNTPTHFRLRYVPELGAAGVYEFLASSYSGTVHVHDALPGAGTYTATISATDGTNEWGTSANISFTVVLSGAEPGYPVCTITNPTTSPSYQTAQASVYFAGTATVTGATIVSVYWMNDATMTEGLAATLDLPDWYVANIPLAVGVNHISVWATDSNDNTQGAGLDITRIQETPSGEAGLGVTLMLEETFNLRLAGVYG